MTLLRLILAFLGGLTLSGCKTTEMANSVDALIVEHSSESIEELSSIISGAIKKPVNLTRHAFAKASRIAIEPKNNVDINVGVIQGMQTEKPPIFQLSLDGNSCQLTYMETGETWTLKYAKCVANKKVKN